MYDAGVLLLHAAERQWAKLCFEYSPQLKPTAVTVVTRGTSDDCNSFEVDGSTLWLRITRSGAAWAFHASTDGAWWRLLRYFALSGDTVRVGFLAQSRSAACSSSTPASYMLANSTLTCAASVKSPAGGSPTNRPASGTGPVPAGSTNISVCAAAVSVSTPLLTRHPGGGLPAGSSANGRLGSFNAVTRVVSHDPD